MHGGVQSTCNICDCKTAQKGHLNEHLEFVHGDVPEYETVRICNEGGDPITTLIFGFFYRKIDRINLCSSQTKYYNCGSRGKRIYSVA